MKQFEVMRKWHKKLLGIENLSTIDSLPLIIYWPKPQYLYQQFIWISRVQQVLLAHSLSCIPFYLLCSTQIAARICQGSRRNKMVNCKMYFVSSLPYQVKTQYLHIRRSTSYFLLPWKKSAEMSRRSILFHN